MPAYRPERVGEMIHQEISIVLDREISDPRLAGINVTHVEVSGDLRYAKIFVALPANCGNAESKEMLHALAHASGYFRRHLAKSLDLRFAPEIRFVVDHAIEKGEHFLQILEQVQAEQQTKNGRQHKKNTK